MKKRRIYTKEQREHVELCTLNGISDVDIIEATGFTLGFVTKTTSSFWKKRMEEKQNLLATEVIDPVTVFADEC